MILHKKDDDELEKKVTYSVTVHGTYKDLNYLCRSRI